jgi:hypothetical protein
VLALILIWLALAAGTYSLGANLLHSLDVVAAFDRIADRALIAMVLGVMLLGLALTITAAWGPVYPLTGAAIITVGIAVALVRPGVRGDACALVARLAKPTAAFLAGLIVLSTAIIACDPVGWYDSGLYHYPLIKWLREYGVAPGLGLLHDAFGQSSIWYALTAFLSTDGLRDRVGPVWGGLLFVLAVGSLMVVISRIAGGGARPADWFVAVAIALVLFPMLQIANSPTPDAPQLFFPTIVSAAILLVEDARKRLDMGTSRVLDPRIVPLLLAAGTAAIKLNGIPLLVVTGLYYLGWPWKPARILAAAIVTGVALLPGMLMAFLATGCPLFPSTLACIATPWTFDRPYIAYLRLVFGEFILRGGTKHAPPGTELEHWQADWIRYNMIGIAGMVASALAATIVLWRSRITAVPGGRAVLACAGLGIAYILVLAPATRYMMGVLPLVPALFVAWAATHSRPPGPTESSPRRRLVRSLVPALVGISVCGVTVLWSQRFNPRSALVSMHLRRAIVLDSFPLLRPPLFPVSALFRRQWNDIAYVSPVDTTLVPGNQLRNYTGLFDENVVSVRCGAAPLPCTPYFAYDDVILRDARRGLAGGFVRREPGTPGHAFIGLRTHHLSDGQLTSQR